MQANVLFFRRPTLWESPASPQQCLTRELPRLYLENSYIRARLNFLLGQEWRGLKRRDRNAGGVGKMSGEVEGRGWVAGRPSREGLLESWVRVNEARPPGRPRPGAGRPRLRLSPPRPQAFTQCPPRTQHACGQQRGSARAGHKVGVPHPLEQWRRFGLPAPPPPRPLCVTLDLTGLCRVAPAVLSAAGAPGHTPSPPTRAGGQLGMPGGRAGALPNSAFFSRRQDLRPKLRKTGSLGSGLAHNTSLPHQASGTSLQVEFLLRITSFN